MLRSMIIGLSIAALLQFGASIVSPVENVALAAHRIDWVKLQTEALSRLVSKGFTLTLR